ncbi:MAG: polysaccharide pyruvyl transferase family protein [Muribaculaceae bacterium]|nr:polysaccharide pyruvyl transferase family protein [Muribaculaceae bacterium]
MKVSILTYHWEDNYGATMQAYATYKAVESLGHEAEFIDLRLPYSPSPAQRIVFGLKRRRFNAFRKRFFKKLTPTSYWSVKELRNNPPKADCYLVGSDQTWNPNIAKDLLPAFFLDFGDENVRRVTYATSIGQNSWEGSSSITDEEICKSLSRFKKVLLREDSAVEISRTTFGRDAEQVIDPVLLFPSYPELIGEPALSGEVIAYKLIDDPGFYEVAKEIADSMNMPIRSIGSVRRPKGYRYAYPERVEDWVNRLASASMVMTDSFHGTVFSILYHRPFVVYVGDPSRTTRIESLLHQLGLSDRLLTSRNTTEEFKAVASTPIDWKNVDEKLSALREDSFIKLKDALD